MLFAKILLKKNKIWFMMEKYKILYRFKVLYKVRFNKEFNLNRV